ncbi:MAG: hypothetical protein AAFQ82_25425, partial [Myxococcota bacterium]
MSVMPSPDGIQVNGALRQAVVGLTGACATDCALLTLGGIDSSLQEVSADASVSGSSDDLRVIRVTGDRSAGGEGVVSLSSVDVTSGPSATLIAIDVVGGSDTLDVSLRNIQVFMGGATGYRVGIRTRNTDRVTLSDISIETAPGTSAPRSWGVLDGSSSVGPDVCAGPEVCDFTRTSYRATNISVLFDSDDRFSTGLEFAGTSDLSLTATSPSAVEVKALDVAVGLRTQSLSNASIDGEGFFELHAEAAGQVGDGSPQNFAIAWLDGSPLGLPGAGGSEVIEVEDIRLIGEQQGDEPGDIFGAFLDGTRVGTLRSVEVILDLDAAAARAIGIQLASTVDALIEQCTVMSQSSAPVIDVA